MRDTLHPSAFVPKKLLILVVPLVVPLVALLIALPAQAGVTPQEQHFGPSTVPAAGCSHCDNEDTRIFIEVTPSLGNLVVDVFDPESVAGGTNFDSATGATAFEIFDPSGSKFSGFTCDLAGACVCDATFTCGALAGSDNTWVNFVTVPNPAVGHWLVTADVLGSGTNGYQVRAHDGDPTAGGEEVQIYFQNAFTPGNSNADSGSRVDTYHPYVTGGCFIRQNDFDYDSTGGAATAGQSIVLSSRSGGFSQTTPNAALSENGEWVTTDVTGFTNASNATDYGVWSITTTINGLTANNRTDNYIGRYDSADPPAPPNFDFQTQPQVFRVYAPSDAGAAPLKPYLSQRVSSTNAALVNLNTRHTIEISFTNPTPYDVTFNQADTNPAVDSITSSNANVITTTVPVNAAITYVAGSAATSAGTIVSQPVGAAGEVIWDPGVVLAGATVTMTYSLDLSPSAATPVPVTGAPTTADGTDAEFLDETGTRDLYFGELCDLSLAPIVGTAVIGDRIFEDSDGNGAFTIGEGLNMVTVNLTGVDGGGNTIVLSAVTDATGFYSFPGLPDGTYTVTVDESTLPVNLQGNNTVDPDGGNNSSSSVTVGVGDTNDLQDFGYLEIADLAITKTLTSPPPFATGQTVDYDLVIDNAGPNGATNVTITDSAVGLTNVVITSPLVCDVSIGPANTFPCVISAIANGGQVTLTVQGDVQ